MKQRILMALGFAAMTGLLVMALSGVLKADAESDRSKLTGSWAPQDATESGAGSLWTFHFDGNKVHITQRDGGNTIADYECSTQGPTCEVKSAGKKAMVSMWFNGSKLIQMETKGSDVVERSFAIGPHGEAMEIEIIPIVPSGKKETFQYKRVQLSVVGKQ